MIRNLLKTALLSTTLSFAVFADGPAMWKLSDDDTNIRILGSVHVLKPGTVWMSDEIQGYINGANKIYFELSPEQQAQAVMTPLVQKYGLLPEGETLEQKLSPEDYAATKTFLAGLGLPEQGIARFKPWMAATVITAFKFTKVGFNPQAGVEATIVAQANARGVKMDGLEMAEDQIKLFAEMSDETQVSFLKSSLDNTDELANAMTTLTENWMAGDTADLTAYFDESFGSFPKLEKRLLEDRNANWVPRLESLLDQPGDFLVVVGTAHILGDQSVVKMLEDKGYKVARIDAD